MGLRFDRPNGPKSKIFPHHVSSESKLMFRVWGTNSALRSILRASGLKKLFNEKRIPESKYSSIRILFPQRIVRCILYKLDTCQEKVVMGEVQFRVGSVHRLYPECARVRMRQIVVGTSRRPKRDQIHKGQENRYIKATCPRRGHTLSKTLPLSQRKISNNRIFTTILRVEC